MGINTVETVGGGGDYRWLRSARGTYHPRSASVNTAAFTVGDVIESGTPVKGAIDALVAADATDTIETLTGFVWHDVTVTNTTSEPVAILTDATIIASLVPGAHDLEDGRYLTDAHGLEGPAGPAGGGN